MKAGWSAAGRMEGYGFRSYSAPDCMAGIGWGGLADPPAFRFNQITHPGAKYVFIEESDNRGYNLGSWVIDIYAHAWIDPLAIWHHDRSTLGFADGHAVIHLWVDDRTIEMCENQWFFQSHPGSRDLDYMILGWNVVKSR